MRALARLMSAPNDVSRHCFRRKYLNGDKSRWANETLFILMFCNWNPISTKMQKICFRGKQWAKQCAKRKLLCKIRSHFHQLIFKDGALHLNARWFESGICIVTKLCAAAAERFEVQMNYINHVVYGGKCKSLLVVISVWWFCSDLNRFTIAPTKIRLQYSSMKPFRINIS